MGRITLLSLCAIAGVALAWLLWRPSDPGDGQLRPSARTLDPRRAPLAARNGSGAAPQGVAAVPAYPHAPDPWHGPGPSDTRAAPAGSVSPGGEAPDPASVAPSSEHAGAGYALSNPGGPYAPPVVAGVAAPPVAPGSPATPAPARSRAAPGSRTPTEAGSPDGEPVAEGAPLTPEQIADKVDEALQDVSPEEREAVEPIVTKQITTNAKQAADWVGADGSD